MKQNIGRFAQSQRTTSAVLCSPICLIQLASVSEEKLSFQAQGSSYLVSLVSPHLNLLKAWRTVCQSRL